MATWISDDGLTRYTHGPDCQKGPNCCCGTCNFIKVGANCSPDCCKCVPRWLCAVFWPDDDPYGEKIKPHTLLAYEGSWNGSLDGIDTVGSNDGINVQLYRDAYDNCYYRLTIVARDIEIDYPIEGGLRPCNDESLYADDRMTCQNPVFELDGFELNGETGTLRFERKMLRTVPFFSPIEAQFSEAIEPCGYCQEFCNRICLEWTNGGTTRKDEFVLTLSDEGDQIYAHPFGDGTFATIAIQQNEDGICEMLISHKDLGSFKPVEMPHGMCSVGMVIDEVDDYDPSKSVSISCNRCSCWDYICEACRCVCPVLCVTTVNGPSADDIVRRDLLWDDEKLRWGDDDKWVSVRANSETGQCEFVVSDWTGTYDPPYDTDISDITADCGGEMSYFLAKQLSDAVEDGNYRYEYGACLDCRPICFGPLICSECCTDCTDPVLPDLLYFDLIGRPVASGEEPGPYAVRCVEVYDLVLAHTTPLFAERHRWEGRAIISCGCPTDSETADPSPDNYLLHVVVTCSGDTWTLNATIRRMEGQIGNDAITNGSPETVSFDCSPVSWTGELELGGLISAALCCCDLATTMDFVISE